MSKIYSNNAETIGGTPLVKINNISDGNIYVKLENRNPAMSVKCRIGASMVAAAEQRWQPQTRHDYRRAHQWQHGDRPGLRGSGQGLRLHTHHARTP